MIAVQQYLIGVFIKKKIYISPLCAAMLFPQMNQQFCDLTVGCISGHAETKPHRKGSGESHNSTRHLIQ